jgi:predicted nuclease with TOPRIM domain
MEIIIALIIIIATSIIAIIMYLKAKKSKHNELSTSIQNKEIITKYNSIVNDNSEIKKQLEEFKYKYSSIINTDLEIKKRVDEIQNKETASNSKLHKQTKKLEELKNKYINASKEHDKLEGIIELYNDDIENFNCGIYKPHFNITDSESYKKTLKENRDTQKEFIKDGLAITGGTGWTVNGSEAEGRKMINKTKRLMLRAYNNECDSQIFKVSWNNVEKVKERIIKALDTINKFGESQNVSLSNSFLDLKIDELHLSYEHQVKKQKEKEEQKELREQMREEEKVRKEADKAQKEAEKEERLYQKAFTEAQNKIKDATGDELEKLKAQLTEIKSKLEQAGNMKERAISMAQQTKAGHVYVISNIGSFGENVYKIGMTRRLEPLDRVKELGGASVPFNFDVHALIYSDNAPLLENTLHKEFHNRKVNLVNSRREFFNVSLEEIEKIVKENYGHIEFTKIAEAKEYRESIIIRKATTVAYSCQS